MQESAVSTVAYSIPRRCLVGRSQFPWLGVSGSQEGTVKWPRESGRLSDRQIGITWSQGGGGKILCIFAMIDGRLLCPNELHPLLRRSSSGVLEIGKKRCCSSASGKESTVLYWTTEERL